MTWLLTEPHEEENMLSVHTNAFLIHIIICHKFKNEHAVASLSLVYIQMLSVSLSGLGT